MIGHEDKVESLVVFDRYDKMVLASGDDKGLIKLWDMESYKCIATFQGHDRPIYAMEVIQCYEKTSLLSSARHLRIWDLDTNTELATFDTDSYIFALKAFVNGHRSCLVSGDGKDNTKVWMEDEEQMCCGIM